jgi:toxin ParE1/3/4
MPARRKSVRLSPRAENDLAEIWAYTADRWSVAQAEKYHSIIVSVFDSLARGTKGRRSDIREGYWKLPAGSHVIYYRENAAAHAVDIIRILHQGMDAERHL